jgi:DNA-binding transcriptional MerR regulator
MRKYVAYYRVSTVMQGRSGLGLEAQAEAVRRGIGNGELIGTHTDVESGKRDDNRPGLQAALKQCEQNQATLIIAKLDRLSRNVHFLAGLMESGIEFICCDMPAANKVTLQIMAALAEQEREMISQRCKDANAARKARGWKRAPYKKPVHQKPRRPYPPMWHVPIGIAQLMETLRRGGMNHVQIAAQLDTLGIKAPRGGKWSGNTIAQNLKRLGAYKPKFINTWRKTGPPGDLLLLIVGLRKEGLSYKKIAARLNELNIATGTGNQWIAARVWELLGRIDARRTSEGQLDVRKHVPAETIELMHKLSGEGLNCGQISRQLTALGLVTPNGKKWERAAVWATLHRRPGSGRKTRSRWGRMDPPAELIQLIRKLRNEGLSTAAIGRRLDEMNIKPALAEKWCHQSVDNVLRAANRKLIHIAA